MFLTKVQVRKFNVVTTKSYRMTRFTSVSCTYVQWHRPTKQAQPPADALTTTTLTTHRSSHDKLQPAMCWSQHCHVCARDSQSTPPYKPITPMYTTYAYSHEPISLLTFLTSTYRDFIFTLLVFSIVDICTARPTRVVVGLALNTVM